MNNSEQLQALYEKCLTLLRSLGDPFWSWRASHSKHVDNKHMEVVLESLKNSEQYETASSKPVD